MDMAVSPVHTCMQPCCRRLRPLWTVTTASSYCVARRSWFDVPIAYLWQRSSHSCLSVATSKTIGHMQTSNRDTAQASPPSANMAGRKMLAGMDYQTDECPMEETQKDGGALLWVPVCSAPRLEKSGSKGPCPFSIQLATQPACSFSTLIIDISKMFTKKRPMK
jgi:hypothetical protein